MFLVTDHQKKLTNFGIKAGLLFKNNHMFFVFPGNRGNNGSQCVTEVSCDVCAIDRSNSALNSLPVFDPCH